jgi:NAD(P)-dependent dehydrogenase (short-subunit alcohol dehydrogenase family)
MDLAAGGVTIAPPAVLTSASVRSRRTGARCHRAVDSSRPYQEASDVASRILSFPASREAGFVTGQTISVNGGRHVAE